MQESLCFLLIRMGEVQMKFTREKMINILETTRKYLETLTDEELTQLGIEQGFWHLSNN